MPKTIARKNSHKHAHIRASAYHDVEKLKKTLTKSTIGMKKYAKQLIAKSIRDAKSKSRSANKKLTTFTHKKPYSSLGIAAAAGICIGFIMTRIINQ